MRNQSRPKQSISFWRKLFCVYEEQEPDPHTKKSSQQETSSHYTQQTPKIKDSMRIVESQLSMQLNTINEGKQLEIVTNKSEDMCLVVQHTIKREQNINPLCLSNTFNIYHSEKLYYDQQDKIAPQSICEHIAKRLVKFHSILEINSQYHQHSIQFSLLGIQVLSLNNDMKRLVSSDLNIQAYKAQKNIQSVCDDFLKTKMKFNQDVVFINAIEYKAKRLNQPKDSYELSQIIKKALKLTQNIVIITRVRSENKYNFELKKIVNMIIQALEGQDIQYLGLEEERIVIDDQHQFTVFYYGTLNNVNQKDLINILRDSLTYKEYFYHGRNVQNTLETLLEVLFRDVRPTIIFKLFLDSLNQHKPENILEYFLTTIRRDYIPDEDFKEIILTSEDSNYTPQKRNTFQTETNNLKYGFDNRTNQTFKFGDLDNSITQFSIK
ncbi:hypothetical protein pb186bvf_007984 [Paramecium bursaria]